MTATQRFIEDAVQGGWKEGKQVNIKQYATHEESVTIGDPTDPDQFLQTASILLDPLAWQAVGNTRGWDNEMITYELPSRTVHTYRGDFKRPAHKVTRRRYRNGNIWRLKMHRFIDHVADGETIEEALQAIE